MKSNVIIAFTFTLFLFSFLGIDLRINTKIISINPATGIKIMFISLNLKVLWRKNNNLYYSDKIICHKNKINY